VLRERTSLSLHHISKRFAGTLALDDVSVVAVPGEVHALLGENGAGKSTLVRIAYGLIAPDAGTIELARADQLSTRTRAFASPRAARHAGIGMVHQHFTSIPAFTVSENIALTAGWPETGRAAERRAASFVAQLGLPLRVSDYVESLSAQLRQRLEIVKALAADASVLLLDEPTAVLAPPEVDELLKFLRGFAGEGGTVVLITHKLDEVFRVADRVSVLRHGVVALAGVIARLARPSLVRAMIGTDAQPLTRRTVKAGVPRVTADRLDLRQVVHSPGHRRPKNDPDRPLAIGGATFSIHAGEIAGVAAIEGNGQRQLLRAIAGVDDVKIVTGTLDVTEPVGFIPEDRTSEGLIPSFSLAESLLLSTLDRSTWWLDWNEIRDRTCRLLAAHDIRASGPGAEGGTLSGGNQQKLIFAMAMARQPRVVVAEDPTRGLDIQAASAIHERLGEAARDGAAVVVHSSDVDEVLALADRVLVVARGQVREPASHPTRELVGEAMLAFPQ
jgi:simple sugar transport system ATP-binding protein